MLPERLTPFDAAGAFQAASVAGAGLRRRAVRSAMVTVLSQGAVFLVQMISTVILARLLTPTDFGIVTMVTTFSLLIMSFGLNGYNEAVLQRGELSRALASNLFWINFGVGIVSAAAFAALGPVLARFYRDDRLIPITAALSLTIAIGGLSVVHSALIKRALRFSAFSANDIFAAAVSVAVSIVLAQRGWSYWALVAGLVTRGLVQAIGAWWLCKWMPSWPSRTDGTGVVARFAAHIYGRFCLNYSTRNTDNLLVGWRFGAGPLGFYKKAYDLFLLPANQLLAPVADVVLSTLSKLQQGSPQYKRYFLNGLSILAFVGMGTGVILTLTGQDLIRLLLGPQWGEAGRIFTFFGPGIGIMLIYGTHGMLHLSLGRADRWLRWVLVELSVTVLLFLLGLHWGAVGVAAAWTASFWILTIPAFWYAGRPIDFGVRPIVEAVWKYVVAAIVAGCAGALIIRSVAFPTAANAAGALARVLTFSLLSLVLYLLAVVVLHGGVDPLLGFARIFGEIVPWNRASKSALAHSVAP